MRIRGYFSKSKRGSRAKKCGKPCSMYNILLRNIVWTVWFSLRFVCLTHEGFKSEIPNRFFSLFAMIIRPVVPPVTDTLLIYFSIFLCKWCLLLSSPISISTFNTILWTHLRFWSCVGNQIIDWLSRLLDSGCVMDYSAYFVNLFYKLQSVFP